MWLTLILVVLMYLGAHDNQIKIKPGMLAAIHGLFAVCIIFNMVTVIVYWTMLHEMTLIKHAGNTGRTIHTYLSHSFPALSVLLLWWINDIRLHADHWRSIDMIAAVYGVWNYIKFKRTGEVLYHFMDWNEASAVLNFALITILFSAVYVLLAKASYWLNPLKDQSKRAKLK